MVYVLIMIFLCGSILMYFPIEWPKLEIDIFIVFFFVITLKVLKKFLTYRYSLLEMTECL